ncbi:hypothetical protein TSA66_09500 [Noviherbaspirillum autotrophicum]|uniref:Uncharacterized protein n=1 Tax=Noviherbaspirillum autotrophicum TaxID=709839 RepID=A0A0C1Y1T2_9BURK|nr:hypothetical protein TSA66_09500 [Noviherbaspirillum autotrophicum]
MITSETGFSTVPCVPPAEISFRARCGPLVFVITMRRGIRKIFALDQRNEVKAGKAYSLHAAAQAREERWAVVCVNNPGEECDRRRLVPRSFTFIMETLDASGTRKGYS